MEKRGKYTQKRQELNTRINNVNFSPDKEIMSLNDYIKRNKPTGKGKTLLPYHSDIVKLKNAGYSLKQIQEYLKSIDVNAVESTISKYLKRNQCKTDQKPPALEVDKQVVEQPDKPKNVTRFVDQDKLTQLKNHRKEEKL